MAIPAYLTAADERMKAAQQAMMNFVDGGGSDPNTRHALLLELHDSMAAFEAAVARLNHENSN